VRRLAGLVLFVLGAVACDDPALREKAESLGRDPGPYKNGPLHRAGQPCTWCHAEGGIARGHKLDLAGTVYVTKGQPEPLVGATIRVFDRKGRQATLYSNAAGNFFFAEGELTLPFPLWVEVESGGTTKPMKTPIFRERSCSACHLDPAGPSSAGPVYLIDPENP
jgi:hypothetical protein